MEIEMKALITAEQFAKFITKFGATKKLEIINKIDTYYTQYATYEERKKHNAPTYRIREEGDEKFLTYKIKQTVNGVERNEEFETKIDNLDSAVSLLHSLGLNPHFQKQKLSFGFMDCLNPNCWEEYEKATKNCVLMMKPEYIMGHVEIEVINGFIYAVELEVIYEPKINLSDDHVYSQEEIAYMIREWFTKEGLSDNIDDRSWMTIIEEESKKQNFVEQTIYGDLNDC